MERRLGAAIGRGVQRPGALERFIPGIPTKVLNERLRKLLEYGLISRKEYQGLPARAEYELTAAGRKFASILEQLREMNAEHQNPQKRATAGARI